MKSFDRPITAAVFGASGGIGAAFLRQLSDDSGVETIHAFARGAIAEGEKVVPHAYDPTTEEGIAEAVAVLKDTPPDLVLVTVGTLHDGDEGPEKALRDLSFDRFLEVMKINAAMPAMIAKHLAPHFKNRSDRAVFASISARVGSISDNRIGGWYSYRSSKAALNQLIKCMSIEVAQRNKEAVCVTLHPGTVDTDLSKPFQKHVKPEKLFTADYSAGEMLKVLDGLTPAETGRCFDYAGKEVQP